MRRLINAARSSPGAIPASCADPRKRSLLRVTVVPDERPDTSETVDRLMGNKPEARFAFISERAAFASEEQLDI